MHDSTKEQKSNIIGIIEAFFKAEQILEELSLKTTVNNKTRGIIV